MTTDGVDAPINETAIRVVCECGGALAFLVLPREEIALIATCPGCGTRYRRQMIDLVRRSKANEIVTVVLPRSRPRG
jgi:hypothetical protein